MSCVLCLSQFSKWESEHVKYFEFLLNCSELSSCVFSAPLPSLPPSESGRRWLRSHPQQQILCFQDCQQRQFLSLLYQWQESHIQGSWGFAPQPRHRPGSQQISDLTGNDEFSFSTSCSLCGCVFVSLPPNTIKKALFMLSQVQPVWDELVALAVGGRGWPLDCYSSASWFVTMWKRCKP